MKYAEGWFVWRAAPEGERVWDGPFDTVVEAQRVAQLRTKATALAGESLAAGVRYDVRFGAPEVLNDGPVVDEGVGADVPDIFGTDEVDDDDVDETGFDPYAGQVLDDWVDDDDDRWLPYPDLE